VNSLCISDIYPLSRRQTFPENVRCLRTKSSKNKDETLKVAAQQLKNFVDLDGGELWFHGLSLTTLTIYMTLFLPIIKSNNFDNECGPGVYATAKISDAKEYALPRGAIMVFKNPDFRELAIGNQTKERAAH
jgi:hypothetical protein